MLGTAVVFTYGATAFFIAVLQPEILGGDLISLVLHGSTRGFVHLILTTFLALNFAFNFIMVLIVDPGSPPLALHQEVNYCNKCDTVSQLVQHQQQFERFL